MEETEKTFETFSLQEECKLHIIHGLLPEDDIKRIVTEVMESDLFRQYEIRNTNEPRLHFLLHEKATGNFDSPQPGYHYQSVKMKSKPLNSIPSLAKLANNLRNVLVESKIGSPPDPSSVQEEGYFNIGIDIILYRDGKDKMGKHADDDQDETIVATAIIEDPNSRVILFQLKSEQPPSQQYAGGDDCRLCPGAGDIYVMDKKVQEHFVHSVLPQRETKPVVMNPQGSGQRLVIVFRRGRFEKLEKDTGRPQKDLSPRIKIPISFGSLQGLEVGKNYTRKELFKLNAHRSLQRGVSGTVHDGCDAIVVSGMRKTIGNDNFVSLSYSAKRINGAGALEKSLRDRRLVRVFRASKYKNPLRAVDKNGKSSGPFYRYDGLYSVLKIQQYPSILPETYVFNLVRNSPRRSLTDKAIFKRCQRLGTLDTALRWEAVNKQAP